MLDPKVAFKGYEAFVRLNEMWLPSFPLNKNYYTDGGYRFRKNYFEGIDHWIPYLYTHSEIFYDLI